MERFIKEYANYQKKQIESNPLMKEEVKTEALKRIKHTLKVKEKGLITVDETIQSILNCFN